MALSLDAVVDVPGDQAPAHLGDAGEVARRAGARLGDGSGDGAACESEQGGDDGGGGMHRGRLCFGVGNALEDIVKKATYIC